MRTHTKRPTGEGRVPAGTLLGLAAATGSLVAARAIVLPGAGGPRPLIELVPLPVEGLGVAWAESARWPVELQADALVRFSGVVGALFLAAASVAFVGVLAALLEGGAARWREVAVRAALGATPRELVGLLARSARAHVASGLSIGVLLGVAGGGALRAFWPGPLAPVGWWHAAAGLVPGLAALTLLAAAAYAVVGVLTARAGALGRTLAAGARASADRREAFLRRGLSAFQAGTAGAILLLASTLAVQLPRAATEPASAHGWVVEVTPSPDRDAAWRGVLEALARVPGIEAESIASPGAPVGLGVRSRALAECGQCSRGLDWVPLWSVAADHHAVAPGFFRTAGLRLEEGRDFTEADGAGSEPVAVVNRTLARSSFQDGKAVGRRIRIGREMDAWYRVVGVVEDAPAWALAGGTRPIEAVYLSAFQHPPRAAAVLLDGSEEAVGRARSLLARRGYAPGAARSLADVRRAAARPFDWLARLALGLATLTLFLAVGATARSAHRLTARRARELATRKALGAGDAHLLAAVLRGGAGTGLAAAAWALFLGTLGVAAIGRSVELAAPGPVLSAGVAAALVGASVLATWRAGRSALAVAPFEVLE